MAARRGSILLLVMFVLAAVSLLAVSFAYRASIEHRLARERGILAQLDTQADSAAAVAFARLAENTNEFDHPAEPWHDHPPLASEDWMPELSGRRGAPAAAFVLEYQVIDEQGKLHLTRASGDAMTQLGMTRDQASSLLDWIDANEDEGPGGGAESAYYLRLARPYRAKNAPPDTLDELLLVRHFTTADYVGEDENGNGMLDPEEDDGPIRLPLDDGDGRLRAGLVDRLTCYGDGRINLNTAPEAVLRTLPLSDGAAGQIAAFTGYRAQGGGSIDEHVFTSVEDIAQLQGLTEADVDVLGQVATFKSEFFRVIVVARHVPSGLRRKVEAVVHSQDGAVGVIWYHRHR